MKTLAESAVLILIGCAIFFAAQCHAEDYIGLQVGQSWAHTPTVGQVMNYWSLDEQSTTGRLSIGSDHDWWGVEAGYSPRLSMRSTHNVTAPDHDITQDISTSAFDMRGRIGLHLSERLTASVFAGVAWVHMDNHESGYNTPDHAPVEWRNSESQFAPEYGIGLRYRLTDRLGLTAEFERIPHVAVSHWTLSSDITTAMVGLQVGF